MSIYCFGTTPMKVDIKIADHNITCEIMLFGGAEWVRAASIVNRKVGTAMLKNSANLDSLRRNLENNAIKFLSRPSSSKSTKSSRPDSIRFFSEYEIRKWMAIAFEELVDKYNEKAKSNASAAIY